VGPKILAPSAAILASGILPKPRNSRVRIALESSCSCAGHEVAALNAKSEIIATKVNWLAGKDFIIG
jgi:hypothetical protein